MLSSEIMLIAEEVVLKGWTHPFEQGKRWDKNMQSEYLPHEVARQFGMAQAVLSKGRLRLILRRAQPFEPYHLTGTIND